eukprot:c10422_g1_i1.p1 GENE.c10422_g1_i1~~c10422_g1_i1.p1  ORF type:complete len:315 (-),score=83.95 c10422_g1_i1:368-1312(-)
MSYLPFRAGQRKARLNAKPYDRPQEADRHRAQDVAELADEGQGWLAKLSGVLTKPINWVLAPITQPFVEPIEEEGTATANSDMPQAPASVEHDNNIDDTNDTITLDIFRGDKISEMSVEVLKENLKLVGLPSSENQQQMVSQLRNYVLEHPGVSKHDAVLPIIPPAVEQSNDAPSTEASSTSVPIFTFQPVDSSKAFLALSAPIAIQFDTSSIPVLKVPQLAPAKEAEPSASSAPTFTFKPVDSNKAFSALSAPIAIQCDLTSIPVLKLPQVPAAPSTSTESGPSFGFSQGSTITTAGFNFGSTPAALVAPTDV